MPPKRKLRQSENEEQVALKKGKVIIMYLSFEKSKYADGIDGYREGKFGFFALENSCLVPPVVFT